MAEGDRTADVVVVGAGSAGCAAAGRLARYGADVLLLEAGGPDTNPAIHDPARVWTFELVGGAEDWGYESLPQAGCNGRTMAQPRGKVLGGSSCLNGMIFIRGHETDFDTWAYLGASGWSYDEVLPYFRRLESFDGGASGWHGADGPLSVMRDYEPHPLIAAMVEAAEQAGVPHNPDQNGETMLEGVDLIHLNIKDGERHNTYRAFIEPVADLPNIRVLADAFAQRLLFEGDRCVGVEILREGKLERIRAEREVVVSAGAFDSPKLLMLSGIGPAEHLSKLGIDVRVDLPGVGQNLQDHVFSPVTYDSKQLIPPHEPGLQQAHAHMFWRSRPGLPGPDLQSLFTHLPALPEATQAPWDPEAPNGYTFASILVRPVSSGSLRLASSDPAAKPLIDTGALNCQVDVDAIVAGIELLRDVGQQEALAPWRGAELAPGPSVTSRQELRDYVRDTASTIYHPTGTCKMGGDEMAVVDPRLAVYGVDGLRIADASVMPLITSANTHAPTVMIGERAADFVASAIGVLPAAEGVAA